MWLLLPLVLLGLALGHRSSPPSPPTPQPIPPTPEPTPEPIEREDSVAPTPRGGRELLRYYAEVAEQASGVSGLADYLDSIARAESNYNPSARNPSSGTSTGDGPPARRLFSYDANQRRYANNPAIDEPDRWAYSGGWFGLMPATALATADRAANTMEPEVVFIPEAAVALATDLVVRLRRNYGADKWGLVRVGWAAPSLIDEPDHATYQRVYQSMRDLGVRAGHGDFADESVNTSRYPGFAVVLQSILSHARGT